MPEPIVTACDYCAEKIIWTVSVTDTPMPVDAVPDPTGNVAIYPSTSGVTKSDVIGSTTRRAHMKASGVAFRVHHKLTCSRAAEWSGPRKTYDAKAARRRNR